MNPGTSRGTTETETEPDQDYLSFVSQIPGTAQREQTRQQNPKPKIACPGCGRSFVSLKGHLAKASGQCAVIRAQLLINSLPGFTPSNPSTDPPPQSSFSPQLSEPQTPNPPDQSPPMNDIEIRKLVEDSSEFAQKFEKFLSHPPNEGYIAEFETVMSAFTKFLFEANSKLPGPIHPAVAYHRKRKQGKAISSEGAYNRTSNPQRTPKRQRDKRNEQYKYDLAQWQYANQRRKIANTLLNSKKPAKLKPTIGVIESYFRKIYETPNDSIREQYETPPPIPEGEYVPTIEEIELAIKKINIDTSPGPDGIVLRTIRRVKCAQAILTVLKIMLRWGYVPTPLKTGRTILIYKGKGDQQDLKNWRPITIFSLLRRIVERCLDQELRRKVKFSQYQRGFVNGMAGTHINASIVDGCLRIAREEKRSCCIVMLDLSKAFDSVGHNHICQTLQTLAVPGELRNLIVTLTTQNQTRIEANKTTSSAIPLRCGVAQGSPLSPTIFNLCQDFILKLISDPSTAREHGFEIAASLEKPVALAFADDTAIVAKDSTSAAVINESFQTALNE
ncbi:unnamed protein product, partial [Nesidiocoris tenuis]